VRRLLAVLIAACGGGEPEGAPDGAAVAIDAPGPPADVGAGDFTIELWLRGTAADNPAGPVACGDNLAWIEGNILLDRDRYDQGQNHGGSPGERRYGGDPPGPEWSDVSPF
jgi:hypothetical protein